MAKGWQTLSANERLASLAWGFLASCGLVGLFFGPGEKLEVNSGPKVISQVAREAKQSKKVERGTILKFKPGKAFAAMCLSDVFWEKFVEAEQDIARGGPGSSNSFTRLVKDGFAKAILIDPQLEVRVINVGRQTFEVDLLNGPNAGLRGWIRKELFVGQ